MLAILSATTFAAFVAGCYLIAVWHAEVSRSVIATYAVLGVTGASALTWPIFTVWLATAMIKRLFRTSL